MGILRRLADAFDPPETRAQQGEDVSWKALSGTLGYRGRHVSASAAENLSTLLACVNAIATAISSLPAYTYRRIDKGREVDEAHPLSRLIRDGANDRQPWPDFVEWLMASTLLRGNGLAEVVTDGAGRLTALLPIPWENVSVQMLPSGRLAYDVVHVTTMFGGTGRPKRLLEGEVLHLRDRTDDGIIGRSRLSRAAAVVSSALSLQEFVSSMWDNGVHPSGVLEAEAKIGPEGLKRLREIFTEAFAGPTKAAKALVLDQGLKWKSISVSPEDAELLASRRFTAEEIARIYQVPPPLVGIWDHSSFTNSETAGRWFAQFCLGPWVRKIETEVARSLFSDASRMTHELELDLSGFVRGDYQARWAAHKIAVQSKILTVNEVREVEGFNPRPGGDEIDPASSQPETSR